MEWVALHETKNETSTDSELKEVRPIALLLETSLQSAQVRLRLSLLLGGQLLPHVTIMRRDFWVGLGLVPLVILQ